MSVVNSMLAFFRDQAKEGQAVRGVHRHPSITCKVVRHNVKHVRPNTTPLIEQRGWKHQRNRWTGHYATKFGTWPGRIEKRGDIFQVYIHRPPAEVRNSGRFQCFSKRSGGWWNIHLHDNPCDGDPSAVVAYVERLLHTSIRKAA